MLRTKQRTNSHRKYVMFQLPFIGCKYWLLVKRYAQNKEQTLIEITSCFNCLSLVVNVNFSSKVTHKTTNKLSWKVHYVGYLSWQKSREDDGKLLILWFSQFPKFWSRPYGKFPVSFIIPAHLHWVTPRASRSCYKKGLEWNLHGQYKGKRRSLKNGFIRKIYISNQIS